MKVVLIIDERSFGLRIPDDWRCGQSPIDRVINYLRRYSLPSCSEHLPEHDSLTLILRVFNMRVHGLLRLLRFNTGERTSPRFGRGEGSVGSS